jgi:hypothetical protein
MQVINFGINTSQTMKLMPENNQNVDFAKTNQVKS